MRCSEISKFFGKVRVLDGVNLDLDSGATIAVLGPSGSGKSTLLSIIGLLAKPSSGELELFGSSAPNSEIDRAVFRCREIAWIFQNPTLLFGRTVIDNVTLPLILGGMKRRDAETEASSKLDSVGLAKRKFELAKSLSGGEKQRLEVARAIGRATGLVLCDEPTASLDRANSDAVIELIVSEKPPATSIVIVTHDSRVAERCDSVVELRNGILM